MRATLPLKTKRAAEGEKVSETVGKEKKKRKELRSHNSYTAQRKTVLSHYLRTWHLVTEERGKKKDNVLQVRLKGTHDIVVTSGCGGKDPKGIPAIS